MVLFQFFSLKLEFNHYQQIKQEIIWFDSSIGSEFLWRTTTRGEKKKPASDKIEPSDRDGIELNLP